MLIRKLILNVVIDEISSKLTHVIASKPGSSKLIYAAKLEKPPIVVNPNWLFHSITHFQLADHSYFPLPSSLSVASINSMPPYINPKLGSFTDNTTSHPLFKFSSEFTLGVVLNNIEWRIAAPIDEYVNFTTKVVNSDSLVSLVLEELKEFFSNRYNSCVDRLNERKLSIPSLNLKPSSPQTASEPDEAENDVLEEDSNNLLDMLLKSEFQSANSILQKRKIDDDECSDDTEIRKIKNRNTASSPFSFNEGIDNPQFYENGDPVNTPTIDDFFSS